MVVIAFADMFATAGRRSERIGVLDRAERKAASKPGCRRYTFAARLADPDRFVLGSEWDSQEALDPHYPSKNSARFQLDLHGLLAQPSDMTIYAVADRLRPVNTRPMDP